LNRDRADFTGGHFRKANFTNADLAGANFTGADFTDVKLYGYSLRHFHDLAEGFLATA